MKAMLGVLMAVAAALPQTAGAQSAADQLSREQARALVQVYLKSQGVRTEAPDFDLENEPDEQELPAFILFHAYYNTATRLTNIGAYAVDRRSGALWEPVACELLHSDALAQLQEQYRDHIGLTAPRVEGAGASPCY